MPSRQQASNHDPNDSETWRTLAAINGTLLFIRTQSTSSRDRSREVGGWPRASQTSVECQLSPSRLPRGGRTKAARWDPSHARTRESFLSTVGLCFASPREATSSGKLWCFHVFKGGSPHFTKHGTRCRNSAATQTIKDWFDSTLDHVCTLVLHVASAVQKRSPHLEVV